MRMQATSSTELLGADSGGYPPKVTYPTLPTNCRLNKEDVPTTHLPHPLSTSSAVLQRSATNATSGLCIYSTPSTHEVPSSVAAKSSKQSKRDLFVCPEVHCGKQFPRSFALRRHMRIHTGTKPYACDYYGCVQRFNTSGNLSRHKRIHSGERPYPCYLDTCGKRFNTSTKLKRHMRIHFPDGQNLFRCTDHLCAWACDNYKEYVQHQKLHCNVVGKETGNATIDIHETSANVKTAQLLLPSTIDIMHSTAEVRHFEFPQPVGPTSTNGDLNQPYSRLVSNVPLVMPKETLEHREEAPNRHESGDSVVPPKAFSDDRTHFQSAPRLPFPTRAFPSETGLLSSSLHSLPPLPPTFLHRYCDPTSPATSPVTSAEIHSSDSASYSYAATHVPYSSYPRSEESTALVNSYQPPPTTAIFMSTSEPQYTQPMRQVDLSQQYETSCMRQQQPPPRQLQAQPGYEGSTVSAEFTGEELSAVLELMKDS